MPEVIFNGPDGRLEGQYHPNKNADAPIAIVLHPNPLHGGNMNNRILLLIISISLFTLGLPGAAFASSSQMAEFRAQNADTGDAGDVDAGVGNDSLTFWGGIFGRDAEDDIGDDDSTSRDTQDGDRRTGQGKGFQDTFRDEDITDPQQAADNIAAASGEKITVADRT